MVGTVERLVDSWPELFGDSNPNGVVVAHNSDGETNSAVVELMEPKLSGSTLTYTVRVLTNEGGPAEAGVNYNFEQVSVFIDDVPVSSWACENPNGGLVDPPGVLNAPIAPNVWRSECEINGGFPIPQRAEEISGRGRVTYEGSHLLLHYSFCGRWLPDPNNHVSTTNRAACT